MLAEQLLTAALAMAPPYYPPGHEPELPQERDRRLAVIAVAIERAAETATERDWWPRQHRAELAWQLWAISYQESRHWALEVHDGRQRGDRHLGGSICLVQINRGNPLARGWAGLAGTDLASTTRCLETGARSLGHALRHCAKVAKWHSSTRWHSLASAHSVYATGSTCWLWSGAGPRIWLAGHGARIGAVPTVRAVVQIRSVRGRSGWGPHRVARAPTKARETGRETRAFGKSSRPSRPRSAVAAGSGPTCRLDAARQPGLAAPARLGG